ncbi:MAG: CDP-alcohol phosphatidyltransferase family protein [Acidimicrobiales bacterium]|nr:CDP-alcohol phosphatidyltransferase family protein [Acidimicrobiales bacterium]
MSDATVYGPSALATPANAVTVIRLLVAPFLFSLMVNEQASWKVFVLWVILAGTDGVDGWIARRTGTTRSGAFLDPLADKVLVLGAMCSLAVVGRWSWFPVVVIGGRELGISLYRVYWGRRGLAVPARASAKAKTLVQSLAVGFAVWPWFADDRWIADWLLLTSVVLAVVSAAQYLLDGSRAATAMEPISGGAG